MFSRAIRPPLISVKEKEKELRSQAEEKFRNYSPTLFNSASRDELINEYVRVELEKFKKDQQEEQLSTYIETLFR